MTSPKNKPDAERARRPLVLEWSLVVLAAAAVAVLAAENSGVRPREAHGAEFQHLVGGLGLGMGAGRFAGGLLGQCRRGGQQRHRTGDADHGRHAGVIPRSRGSSLGVAR